MNYQSKSQDTFIYIALLTIQIVSKVLHNDNMKKQEASGILCFWQIFDHVDNLDKYINEKRNLLPESWAEDQCAGLMFVGDSPT